MRRKPARPFRDIVPTPANGCRGLCMDVTCPVCWGDVITDDDDLEAMDEQPPLRLVVEIDDATYAALDAAAAKRGVPIEEAAAAVLRERADRRRR